MTTFVFPDIETTGLKPGYDQILEVAWRITDETFAEIGTPRTFIVEHGNDWGRVWSLLNNGPEVVREMHKKSGLWSDMHSKAAYDIYGIAQAFERDVKDALERQGEGSAHLAGLSVGFDREFLNTENAFEGIFDGIVHHRILDLSSVKLLYGTLGWQVPEIVNLHPHRALSDVDEAISLARTFHDELKYSDFVEVEL